LRKLRLRIKRHSQILAGFVKETIVINCLRK